MSELQYKRKCVPAHIATPSQTAHKSDPPFIQLNCRRKVRAFKKVLTKTLKEPLLSKLRHTVRTRAVTVQLHSANVCELTLLYIEQFAAMVSGDLSRLPMPARQFMRVGSGEGGGCVESANISFGSKEPKLKNNVYIHKCRQHWNATETCSSVPCWL